MSQWQQVFGQCMFQSAKKCTDGIMPVYSWFWPESTQYRVAVFGYRFLLKKNWHLRICSGVKIHTFWYVTYVSLNCKTFNFSLTCCQGNIPSCLGAADCPKDPSLVLILKWGGELTPAGKIQAEKLGQVFRCMYPGGEGWFVSLHLWVFLSNPAILPVAWRDLSREFLGLKPPTAFNFSINFILLKSDNSLSCSFHGQVQ